MRWYNFFEIVFSDFKPEILVTKNKVADLAYGDIDSASEGMIALVPDFEEFRVKLIITDNYAKYLAAIPIQEFQNGEVETDNEYVYYFSFQFGK